LAGVLVLACFPFFVLELGIFLKGAPGVWRRAEA
jgi:uncharacterized protein YjeT (DUF2065 family)